MIASVHVADLGWRKALATMVRVPKAGSIAGLRTAGMGLAAPLSKSLLKKPSQGRIGMIAFWDDDASIDAFLSSHPLAAKLSHGWRVRLEPLRAHGWWPGLPDDVPRDRVTGYTDESVVITLGRFRWRRAGIFFRTSSKAEAKLASAPGLVWATGIAKPPFVATVSLWQSTRALSSYAYGKSEPHRDAIEVDKAKQFHHQSAFIRFRPYAVEGHLDGKNPLPAKAFSLTDA